MVSAIRSSARSLRDYILQTKSRAIGFAKGQGTPGHRFAPKQAGNNDANIGSRLDNGDIVTRDGDQYRRYKFQLNKNAQNSILKDEAQKDSHKVWAQVDVQVKENPTYEESKTVVREAFDDIERQL
ncbi:hypothetical protein EMCG_02637 [[Emmonsia] crescens]|uniref:Uncharacterized protein n=1 Tax=[Emmonsia] crescens TaxID=73230 RepID=A0A0G2J195_9EURO|nr:hypothetical protein EMCG_02637 [Emmonsia crescens UAMH 3008]